MFVIFTEIHVEADENGVLVAENLRHLEVDTGDQCAEVGDLFVREVGEVEGHGVFDLLLKFRQISELLLCITIDFFNHGVADETFDRLNHFGVVPRTVCDDIVWIFSV